MNHPGWNSSMIRRRCAERKSQTEWGRAGSTTASRVAPMPSSDASSGVSGGLALLSAAMEGIMGTLAAETAWRHLPEPRAWP